jgi:hypothetical protein
MEPFDLIAVKFRDPGVRVKKVDVPLDRRLQTVLEMKLEDLKQRTALLGNPPMMGVLSNPSFELPSKPGQIPGWSLVNPVRGAISTEPEPVNKEASPDPNVPRKPVGKQALKFVNQGPSAAVCLRSSARRPTRATRAPSRSIASAAALPMPVPAPVMSTTFPSAAMRRTYQALRDEMRARRSQ